MQRRLRCPPASRPILHHARTLSTGDEMSPCTPIERYAFTDIQRLQTATGKVPYDIPDHYWRYCWHMRRSFMGNRAPRIGWQFVPPTVIALPHLR